MEKNTICSACGVTLTDEATIEFDGKIFCDECLRKKTIICDCCGKRIYRDEAQVDEITTLCNDCYEYNYTHCENCGTMIHNDDARYEDDSDYPYCAECFAKLQECAIKSYNYKPEPIFYGSGNFFMGVELEIDKGGEMLKMRRFYSMSRTVIKSIYTASTTAVLITVLKWFRTR